MANVISIQKKEDKALLNNYRLVSLTSLVGKQMETVITDKLLSFLEENDFIRNTQHSFEKKTLMLNKSAWQPASTYLMLFLSIYTPWSVDT